MRAIAGVAERYGRGRLHLTTRQGIEIHFVRASDAGAAVRELESAGVTMGADGPRVRIITACPGSETCRWGIIDTKEIARRAGPHGTSPRRRRTSSRSPSRVARTTAPRRPRTTSGSWARSSPAWEEEACTDCGACVKVCPKSAIRKVNDEYVVDTALCLNCSRCTTTCPQGAWTVVRQGFVLWIGGTMGKTPRLATRMGGLIESEAELFSVIERAFACYRENGRRKERFGHMIDRIGLETVMGDATGSRALIPVDAPERSAPRVTVPIPERIGSGAPRHRARRSGHRTPRHYLPTGPRIIDAARIRRGGYPRAPRPPPAGQERVGCTETSPRPRYGGPRGGSARARIRRPWRVRAGDGRISPCSTCSAGSTFSPDRCSSSAFPATRPCSSPARLCSRWGSSWPSGPSARYEPGALTTTGPYAYVRHPMYTGYVLRICRPLPPDPQPPRPAALLAIPAQIAVARREEAALEARYGAAYRAYAARTGRFWPRMR